MTHTFNPSTRETETGGSFGLRLAWSTEPARNWASEAAEEEMPHPHTSTGLAHLGGGAPVTLNGLFEFTLSFSVGEPFQTFTLHLVAASFLIGGWGFGR